MFNLAIGLVILSCIIVICYFLTKIIDWKKSRNPFRDNDAEFLSDMYKVKQKWAKRGEYDFCKIIDFTLEKVLNDQQEEEAETDYGKTMQKSLSGK